MALRLSDNLIPLFPETREKMGEVTAYLTLGKVSHFSSLGGLVWSHLNLIL